MPPSIGNRIVFACEHHVGRNEQHIARSRVADAVNNRAKRGTVGIKKSNALGRIIQAKGDKRQIGSFSTLMLHSPQWFLSGSDQKIFNDYATLARHYKNLVSNIFAQRTGKHSAEWWEKFIYSGRDRFLTAEECIELGLADEIYGLDFTTPPPPTPGAGITPDTPETP